MARKRRSPASTLPFCVRFESGEVDMAAEERVHARREPVIGDVFELDAGGLLEERREDVARRGERRADGDLARPPLRVLRELGPTLPRRLGARGEHRGGRRDHADRLEVRVSDVAEAGIEGQVDVVVDGVERVAVGRRVLRLARADRAGRAADIDAEPVQPQALVRAAPHPQDVATLRAWLAAAERPLVLAGSSLDRRGGREALLSFAESWGVPAVVSFRRQDLFPNTHRLYAGDMGLSNPATQMASLREADLLLVLGARLSDITSQG